MTTIQAPVPAATTGPPPPRRRPLKTLRDIRRELANLYWCARREEIPSGEASRLCFLLVSLARIVEGDEIEQRIAALEGAASRGSGES